MPGAFRCTLYKQQQSTSDTPCGSSLTGVNNTYHCVPHRRRVPVAMLVNKMLDELAATSAMPVNSYHVWRQLFAWQLFCLHIPLEPIVGFHSTTRALRGPQDKSSTTPCGQKLEGPPRGLPTYLP
jgi:hypothetical protein